MTRQRRLIYDIICRSDEHLTADKIHKLAKNVMPSIAVGTVYRNLNLMCQCGEIMRVVIDNEPDRFDKNPKYHDHIICDGCGMVSDIFTEGLEDIIRDKTGIPIKSYNLTVHYYCDECRKKLQIKN